MTDKYFCLASLTLPDSAPDIETPYCFFCGQQIEEWRGGGAIAAGVPIDGIEGRTYIGCCVDCAPELAYIVGVALGDQSYKRSDLASGQMLSKFWQGLSAGQAALINSLREGAAALERVAKRRLKELNEQYPRDHNQTRLTQFVYLMRRPDGNCKIGLTSDVNRRLGQISRDFPGTALLHSIECDDMNQAERILHLEFSAKRRDGEWFDLDEEEIGYLMQIVRFEKGGFLRTTPMVNQGTEVGEES